MAEPVPVNESFWLQAGYKLELMIENLTFPVTCEITPDGNIYFLEAGFAYPYIFTTPSLSMLRPDGTQEIISTDFNKPLIGCKWHDGALLVTHRGVLSRITLDGKKEDLVTGLPAMGDHHTNHIVVKDGKVYFGQGSATNAGVVGFDNFIPFGWLKDYKDSHDIPPYDITLTGRNFSSRNPFNPFQTIETGPFLPIGQKASADQVIPGQLKSNSVIYRCNPDGSELEVFAWGLRNPFALELSEDGRIFCISQGGDRRGSRPIESPDAIYEIKEGAWYGFPDYFCGISADDASLQDVEDPQPGFIMENHPEREEPLHCIPTHSAAVDMKFCDSDAFGYKGEAFVAEYGAGAPVTTGGRPSGEGFKISRFNPETKEYIDFYRNENPGFGGKGPERPAGLKFSPDGDALYVVDAGILGAPSTGAIWKITKE